MVFPVVGGNESKGYDVENSLRLNASDSPQLSKDMSGYSNATNTKKFTTSFWLKLGNVPQTSYGGIIDVGGDHTISLFSDNTLYFFENGGSDLYWRPTRLFRDSSAWYNIIIIADSTLSTQTDRVKIYVNGVIETSFHNNSGPSQNHDFAFNTVNTRYIGRKQSTSSSLDGYLTEIHHIDGQAKAHTDFGKFDDNGVWIPIKYTGTYGDTGYYLEFKQTGTSQNSSGIGADTSGEDNHFAVSNLAALDVTEDTCTNNFATINSLANQFNPATLSEGNTRVDFHSGVSTVYNISTIGVSSGKWYCEIKAVTIPDYAIIGIASRPCIASGNSDNLTVNQYNYGYHSDDGNVKSNSSSGVSYGNTYDDGDIIGIALDLDNNKLYFSKNGTFQNSGDPTSGSTGTGAVSIQAPSGTIDGVYYFAVGDNRNDHATRMDCNFGNPAFSISSGNSDGKYGNFEYSVPSGYYALCTKRLAEFG